MHWTSHVDNVCWGHVCQAARSAGSSVLARNAMVHVTRLHSGTHKASKGHAYCCPDAGRALLAIAAGARPHGASLALPVVRGHSTGTGKHICRYCVCLAFSIKARPPRVAEPQRGPRTC